MPSYGETMIHVPHINPDDDMLVDGLPSGSYFSFMWNFLISISFQFVGFVLTYLMHTTHAAKFGSRAGLGITLIQYGLFSRGQQYKQEQGIIEDESFNDGSDMQKLIRKAGISLIARDWFPLSATAQINGTMDGSSNENIFAGTTARDWIAFLLMTIGESSVYQFSAVLITSHSQDGYLSSLPYSASFESNVGRLAFELLLIRHLPRLKKSLRAISSSGKTCHEFLELL